MERQRVYKDACPGRQKSTQARRRFQTATVRARFHATLRHQQEPGLIGLRKYGYLEIPLGLLNKVQKNGRSRDRKAHFRRQFEMPGTSLRMAVSEGRV